MLRAIESAMQWSQWCDMRPMSSKLCHISRYHESIYCTSWQPHARIPCPPTMSTPGCGTMQHLWEAAQDPVCIRAGDYPRPQGVGCLRTALPQHHTIPGTSPISLTMTRAPCRMVPLVSPICPHVLFPCYETAPPPWCPVAGDGAACEGGLPCGQGKARAMLLWGRALGTSPQ